jgi:TolA-binding protein
MSVNKTTNKMTFSFIIFSFFAVTLTLTACVTPKEKKEMQDDIFSIKTRLMNVEREVTDTTKESKNTGDSAAKRLASTRAELDKIAQDIQQIRGEIDALKVGVQTGRIPGVDESQGSVAATIESLAERLSSVEADQQEVLDAIKSAGKKSKAPKKERKTTGSAVSLQKAFDGKQYKTVLEDAPKLLNGAKGDEKERIRFLQAESLFKLGKIRDAALKYNEFVEDKPAKEYIPVAKMRLGDCFRHLGDASTARLYYEELIKEFPKSDEAGKAKERLADFDAKGQGSEAKGG